MNLLLFTAADLLTPSRLAVSDRRLRYLLGTTNAEAGMHLRVGELGGHMGTGVVAELSAHRAVIEFTLDTPPPPRLPVILLLALPRPKMLRRLLRSSAELGLEALYLINSYRVEKSYWQSRLLAERNLEAYLREGLEQGCDTVMPSVYLEPRFKPFVEDRLPALMERRRGLLAHPDAAAPPPNDLDGEPTVIAIGPEGGFIPYEVEKFRDRGFSVISLGPRILRVETAVVTLLGRLLPTP